MQNLELASAMEVVCGLDAAVAVQEELGELLGAPLGVPVGAAGWRLVEAAGWRPPASLLQYS